MSNFDATDLVKIDEFRTKLLNLVGDGAANSIRINRLRMGCGYKSEMDLLTCALEHDADYAWVFHCTISTSIQGTFGLNHAVANYQAAVIMGCLFGKSGAFLSYWESSSYDSTLKSAKIYGRYVKAISSIKIANVIDSGYSAAWKEFTTATEEMRERSIPLNGNHHALVDELLLDTIKTIGGNCDSIRYVVTNPNGSAIDAQLKAKGIKELTIVYDPPEE